jgi:LysM repeat protein
MNIKDFVKAKEKINEQFKKGQITKEQRSNALKKLREARSAARAGRLSKTPIGQFINYLTGSKPLSSIVDKKAATTRSAVSKLGTTKRRMAGATGSQAKAAATRKAINEKANKNKRFMDDKRAFSQGPNISETKKASKSTHKIVVGDNLTKIAKRYGTTISALKKLNNIKDVDKIYAGRTLKLPEGSGVPLPKPRPKQTKANADVITKQIKKAIGKGKTRAGKYGR